jgi:hypothetical protein
MHVRAYDTRVSRNASVRIRVMRVTSGPPGGARARVAVSDTDPLSHPGNSTQKKSVPGYLHPIDRNRVIRCYYHVITSAYL